MISVVFDLDNQSADYGKVIVSVSTGLSSSAEGRVAVSGPLGAIKTLPVNADFTGNSGTVKVLMQKDSSGNFVQGNYTARVQMKDLTGSPPALTVVSDEEETFAFCDYRSDLSIEVTADCYARTLVVKDNTTYRTGHVLTRAITVQSPVIACEPNEADIISAESPLLVTLIRDSGIAYQNVTYNVSVVSDLVYSQTIGEIDFEVQYTNRYSEQTLIKCNLDACSVLGAVDARIKALIESACKHGGICNLPSGQMDELSLLNSYLSMYNYWVQCKNQERVNYYYDKLKALVGECGCTPEAGPIPIPETSFVYLRGFSNYELWIQAGNTGTLNDYFLSLFPITDWVQIPVVNYAQYSRPDLEQPMEYRITRTHIEFRGRVIKESPSQGSNPLPTAAIFVDLDLPVTGYGAVNVYNSAGEHVAQLRRNTTTPTRWDIVYDALYIHGDPNMFYGQVPLDTLALSSVNTGGIYPGLGEWTALANSNLNNSFTVVGANPLSWRTDGRFIYFKGAFGGGTWTTPGSGVTIIPASYWSARGIVLTPGSAVNLIETDTTNQGLMAGTFIVDASGNLQVWPTGLVTGAKVIVAGTITRND